MHNLRFIFSFVIAFLKRFYLVFTIGAFVGVIGFLGIRLLITRVYPSNITYIGQVGRYHADELPSSILNMIGEGLTKLDEHGLPKPAIAKSWKTEDSGKTWEFEIDTSKKWQDGTNVTSQSLSYSFENVTVTRPNDHTIVFKLTNAYSPFPVVLARPAFKQGLIGTGEWTVSRVSLSNGMVDKLELSKSGQRKMYRFFSSGEASITAFNLGQLDRIERLTAVDSFNGWKTITISETEEPLRYVGVFFNIRDGVLKDNKSLRQALSYAITKDKWANNRAVSPVPDNSWAFNREVKTYDYDEAHAKDLLKTSVKKGETLKITLLTVPELLSVADNIAKDWEKVGVATTVQVTNEVPTAFDVFLAQYDVSLDPDQYLTWHSTQTDTNLTHYTNPRIDKLLEDGRIQLDREKRRKDYLDFQRFLLEDVPVLPLYHPISYTVTRK